MEELLKSALAFIPNYLADLFRLIQGPKRFVAEKVSPGDVTLKDSLIFFAISILLAWVLETAVVGREDFFALAKAMIFTFALAVAYGAALCLAWRIVKGDADPKAMFLVTFYYAGVLQLIAVCCFMATMGALHASKPDTYNELMKSVSDGSFPSFMHDNLPEFQKQGAFLPVKLVGFSGLAALLFWLIAGWGAYRELNHLSKVRSALAAFLFLAFCVPVTAYMFLMASEGASMHVADPKASATPK